MSILEGKSVIIKNFLYSGGEKMTPLLCTFRKLRTALKTGLDKRTTQSTNTPPKCINVMDKLYSPNVTPEKAYNSEMIISSIISNLKYCKKTGLDPEHERSIIFDKFHENFQSRKHIIFFLDKKGDFVAVNRTFCQTCGIKKEKILNSKYNKYIESSWLKNSFDNKKKHDPGMYPGLHFNHILDKSQKKQPLLGSTWAITNEQNTLLGAWSVYSRLK